MRGDITAKTFNNDDLEALKQKASGFVTKEARVNCTQVLEALAPSVFELCGLDNLENWPRHCYRTLLATAFPEHGTEITEGEATGEVSDPYYPAVIACMDALQYALDEERKLFDHDEFMDFEFLDDQEISACRSSAEYRRFLGVWRDEYVYEMLRLCDEIMPYTTLAHIASVHHVAMMAARGFQKSGCMVDPALVSAAAAVHDIGKFGCRKGERVPYLHYYYTSVWCERNRLHTVGEVAGNHSTWDLELESLPSESLCLIYADFRSKDKRVDGKNVTTIFSLKESFDVILSKLDNVDDAKKRRYRLVYSRLRDMEDLLIAEGVDVNNVGIPMIPRRVVDLNVQTAEELVESLIFSAIRSNTGMLYELTSEQGFVNMLEKARTEKDWKHLRAYLEILREFSMYLGLAQKRSLVDFLYDLLSHREGDIRREAAAVLGIVIAQFNSGYRKELPVDAEDISRKELMSVWEDILNRIISPDHKFAPRHVSWMGFTLKLVFTSLYEHAFESDIDDLMEIILGRYNTPDDYNENEAFVLLDTMSALPISSMDEEKVLRLLDFASVYYKNDSIRLRVSAGRFFKNAVCEYSDNREICQKAVDAVMGVCERSDETMADRYLRMCILETAEAVDDVSAIRERAEEIRQVLNHDRVRRQIFLDNLKTDTHWMVKAVNVEFLLYFALNVNQDSNPQTATHLCNLLKVSEYVGVRQEAGDALLKITPTLGPDQKNEVAIELLKALESGDYTFSKYIPPFLGKLSMQLPMEQRKELLSSLRDDISSVYSSVVSVALDTIWCMLSESTVMVEEETEEFREKMLGIILTGLAHYEPGAFQNSMLLYGKIFAEGKLDSNARNKLLGLSLQKFLPMMRSAVARHSSEHLTKYYSTAAMSHLWRFITEYQVDRGNLVIPMYKKVAFFPGTFDPFTLSHKGIVDAMQDAGFEVYLAIDEFSWSKNTQPHLRRRQIVSMSVAEQFHVHIFPDDVPINLANPTDLDKLDEIFAGREVYIVVGSDVVRNASAYKAPATPGCIRERNHIIFLRGGDEADKDPIDTSCIEGHVVTLNLPRHLEDVSSNRIRESVDSNRDISAFTEPLVQEFIYRWGLYLREGTHKTLERNSFARFDHISESGHDYIRLYDDTQGGSPIAYLKMRILESHKLLEAGLSINLADQVRERSQGKILLIEDAQLPERLPIDDALHMLVSEGVLYGIKKGCTTAVYYCYNRAASDALRDVLERQGFLDLYCDHDGVREEYFTCNLKDPIFLLMNLRHTIKEPFISDPRMLKLIQKNHEKLQRSMTVLYPGHAVISIYSNHLLQQLSSRITGLNGVPEDPVQPRVLGPYMAVPFGKILRGRLVPNTVTKTLRTDRVFSPDLRSFTIDPFPGYPSLRSQLRTIHSFGRPIILVDDILNRSGRLKGIIPMLKEEGIDIRQVLLGVLTDYGKDSMYDTGIEVEGIYRIPSIRKFILESALYPYVGGDSVQRSNRGKGNLIPSINRIYPYCSPEMEGSTTEREVEYSRTVLECAMELYELLETLYREHYGRKLTMGRLGEAIVLPVMVDRGAAISIDEGLAPTALIETDMEALDRHFR